MLSFWLITFKHRETNLAAAKQSKGRDLRNLRKQTRKISAAFFSHCSQVSKSNENCTSSRLKVQICWPTPAIRSGSFSPCHSICGMSPLRFIRFRLWPASCMSGWLLLSETLYDGKGGGPIHLCIPLSQLGLFRLQTSDLSHMPTWVSPAQKYLTPCRHGTYTFTGSPTSPRLIIIHRLIHTALYLFFTERRDWWLKIRVEQTHLRLNVTKAELCFN